VHSGKLDGKNIFQAAENTITTFVPSLRWVIKLIVYQTSTKESKWDMPDELLLLLETVETDPNRQILPAATFVLYLLAACAFPNVFFFQAHSSD
jgi:hypothetical protein